MKKIKQLSKEELDSLNKAILNCEIITFDKEDIERRINEAYAFKTKGHELLLQADILLDEVLKELYGKTKNRQTRGKTNRGTKK